ncbi:hypothetical protein JKF63_07708 [Porcisia hertigi]|uniref:N-acetyltransferase ESCO zinc-finger domain-containing protein n=1 Tax=Porcisia hertigi TaxID=2761500 RepID=A0A836LLZ7_9TRYP|nr:hypothetical protein JKF63_07708 [Porcisia hertigi]
MCSSSSSGSGEGDEEAGMLLGELLFGADVGRVNDERSLCHSSPAAPSALLDIAAPVSPDADAATASGGCAAPPCLRRSRPPPRLTQTTLDFGQAGLTIATRCSLCGMLYTAEDDEDAALHKRFCREGRLRRVGRGRRDLPPSFAAAPRSQRPRTEASASSSTPLTPTATEAVRMLEELSGVSVGHSLISARAHTNGTSSRSGQRGQGIVARGLIKAMHPTTKTLNDVGGAPLCVCARVFCQVSSSSHCTTPLEVFHVACNPSRLSDDNTGDCTALRLLELLGFTPVVLRAAAGVSAPQAALSSVLLKSVSDAPRAQGISAPTVHVVCVVDAVLRRLLCAVVGESRRREQDPELRIEVHLDGGGTRCTTRRHFTYGDVEGLWLCSPAELSAAQGAWAKTTAAPFSSSRLNMVKFFGLRTGGGAPPTTESRAGHTTNDAYERCQRATGVALHTLAQHLVYGKKLCPSQHLSYAQAALAYAVACVGDGFVEQSLTIVSSFYPADAMSTPREDAEEPLPLYAHGHDDGSSDSDDSQ